MHYELIVCNSHKYNKIQEDETADIQHVQAEIDFLFRNTTTYIENEIKLDGKDSNLNQLLYQPRIYFNTASKQLKQIVDGLVKDSTHVDIVKLQKFILDLLGAVRYGFLRSRPKFKTTILSHVEVFAKFVQHPSECSDSHLDKILEECKRIELPSSTQYLHFYINILWMLTTLEAIPLEKTFNELVFISYKYYERFGNAVTPCSCFKTLWLRLQLYIEHKQLNFWTVFNESLQCYDESFSIRILNYVAFLQLFNGIGYYIGSTNNRVEVNFSFLCGKLEGVFKNTQNDAELLKILTNSFDLLTKWWLAAPKLDFIYLAWDYYYKKLESIQFNQDFVQLMEEVNGSSIKFTHSYHLFVKILLIFLRQHPQLWNKFRGRIYTRFSPAKFGKLNENGVNNLMLLFFVLVNINYKEISSKIQELVVVLSKNSLMTWNLHINLLRLHLANNESIEEHCKPFMELISAASQNRQQFNLISHFVNQLDVIVATNDDCNLGQSSLFNQWIDAYLQHCQHSDLVSFLHAAILLIEKVTSAGIWFQYEKPFVIHILPTLKRLAVGGSSCEFIGNLAALIANNQPIGVQNETSAYFIGDLLSLRIVVAYFTTLAKHSEYVKNTQRDELIVKAWFHAEIVGGSNVDFARLVTKLDVFQTQQVSDLSDFIEWTKTNKSLYDNLDKFLAKQLDGAGDEKRTQLIYTNMALVFNKCGSVLYSRISSDCIFSRLIDLLLLPMDVRRGKKPKIANLRALERTWFVYFASIFKMNSNDAYLEHVLKDLIIKYVPHFVVKPTPLARVLDSDDFAIFVLSKINNEFFLQGIARATDEQLYRALNTLNLLIDAATTHHQRALIIQNSFLALCEVYMFKNHKVTVLDMIKRLIDVEQSATIRAALMEVCRKHIAFNTKAYFELMYVVARPLASDVRAVLPAIRDEICVVEAKRGLGFDNNLRSSLERLQKMLPSL